MYDIWIIQICGWCFSTSIPPIQQQVNPSDQTVNCLSSIRIFRRQENKQISSCQHLANTDNQISSLIIVYQFRSTKKLSKRKKRKKKTTRLEARKFAGHARVCVHACFFRNLLQYPVYFRRLTAITDFSRTGRLNPRNRWNTMHAIFQQKLKAPKHRGRPARYYDERTLFPPRLHRE